MKIAQLVVPAGTECNPRDIERLAAYLSAQLVADGHDVTLLTRAAPAAPRTFASSRRQLRSVPLPDSLHSLLTQRPAFDIIHLHGDVSHSSAVLSSGATVVATLHSYPSPTMLAARASLRGVALVAVNEHQRTLFDGLQWRATIAHGLPHRVQTFRADPDNYLVYAGSLQSSSALRRAVEIAVRTGYALKIADRIVGRELEHIERQLAPWIDLGASVEFLGELPAAELGALVSRARALLFTDEWPDPLPLVMLLSLAGGTPIVAWRSGASEFAIQHGETGFVIASVDEAVDAVARLPDISRFSCRRAFDERFGIQRMAKQYASLYEEILRAPSDLPTEHYAALGGRGGLCEGNGL